MTTPDARTLEDVIAAHIDRTDCSEAPGDGSYLRWIICQCGWKSERSQERINRPDLRAIHAAHVAEQVREHLASEAKDVRDYRAAYMRCVDLVEEWDAEDESDGPTGDRADELRAALAATLGGVR